MRLTPAELLRSSTMAVIGEIMSPKPGEEIDVVRLISIADSVAAIAGALEPVPIDVAQALMNLKSARLRVAQDANLAGLYAKIETIGNWTPADDRAVAAGQVAELLDAMSTEQIERVRLFAKGIIDEPDATS